MKEKVRNYIIAHSNVEDENGETLTEWETVKERVKETFLRQAFSTKEDKCYYHYNSKAAFEAWAQGLPTILDTRYYLYPAAKDLCEMLPGINKSLDCLTEDDIEYKITSLIYDELEI